MVFKILILLIFFCFISQSRTNEKNLDQSQDKIKCQLQRYNNASLLFLLRCKLKNESDGVQVSSKDNEIPSVQSLNLQVGLHKDWPTPWKSLSYDPYLIQTIIWQDSKLSEMGEYTFKDLKYLRKIDLSHNMISQLKPSLFSKFEANVIELVLSFNKFQQVPSELFEAPKLQNLKILRLFKNPITHLNKESFDKIKHSVMVIDLNYCKISSIEKGTFDQMESLKTLSLDGNQIQTLDYHTFKNLNLINFHIGYNPLNCNCFLRWLIDFIKKVKQQKNASKYHYDKSENSTTLGFLKCDKPSSLKSKDIFINELTPDLFTCDIEIEFRNGIKSSEYKIGDIALINCDVYSNPVSKVYWILGEKVLEKNLSEKYNINEIQSSSTFNKTSVLMIKNLELTDFGVYSCIAEIIGTNIRKQKDFNVKEFKTRQVDVLSFVAHCIKSRFWKFFAEFKSKFF